jgi:hypothetical protein
MRITASAAGIMAAPCLTSFNARASNGTREPRVSSATPGEKPCIDLTLIDQESYGSKVDHPSDNGADVRRFCVLIDRAFDNVWPADLRTHFNTDEVPARLLHRHPGAGTYCDCSVPSGHPGTCGL